jgi:UDP-N-acetylmuramoyl-L-alanyl-D-glutamate--2,6-diaminopimelate ligase
VSISFAELATLLGAERLGAGEPNLTDVCQDSRDVHPGALFVARAGGQHDGLHFVADALARGAVAILANAEDGQRLMQGGSSVPCLVVVDPMRSLSLVAERVHGRPSAALKLIGITGTNGKTTTANLLRQCLTTFDQSVATLGTLGLQFGEVSHDTGLTTAQADVISRFLRQVVDQGATHAAMEVSSHALEQGRVDELDFAVAAFSNLTQDHLDYHGTLEHYGAAKALS